MTKPRFFRILSHLNWRTLKKTFTRVGQRRLLGLASEMAFNAILSLFPSVLAILTAIGLFETALQDSFTQIANQLSQVAPQEVLDLVGNFAQTEITDPKNSGLFSVSFIAAIWTASGTIGTGMTALDLIDEIPSSQRRPFWKAKIISILLTIGTIILLLIASFLVFISDIVLKFVVGKTAGFLNFLLHLWDLMRWPLTLCIVAVTFAFIYRYGPSLWKKGTPIMPGALFAAATWAGVSNLFRLYVENFGNYNKVYGTVGAVIVLMLWLQVSSTVILVGNQLNIVFREEIQAKSNRNMKNVKKTTC
ncbi:MAG: YihY/virulence factor BrkB family protein [Cyanobacteria bacterium P01_A01_bin.45]